MTKRHSKPMSVTPGVSRRQLLKVGSMLVPATLMLPDFLIRSAQAATSATTFDYYISPTGSNSNPGTLASPWALTAINSKGSVYAGKRVGFLPGTYDVSSLMTSDDQSNNRTPVMNINGGPNSSTPTYLGSSGTDGNYAPRTVTFDAKGASGVYGGGVATTSPIMGCNGQVANRGNWIVDGFVFTGFALWAFHVGDSPGGGASINNWTIQNCEFTGGSARNVGIQPSTGQNIALGTNVAPLIVYVANGGTVTNNYFHNNVGWTDSGHFSCVYQWGYPLTQNVKYYYNTIVASGNVHSKEATQYNCEIAYNYIDMTGTNPLGTGSQNASCVAGFGCDGGAGTLTSIHHNVLISPTMEYISLTNDAGANGWDTPCHIYNNTCVASGNQNTGGTVGVMFFEMKAGTRVFMLYNNLFYDAGHATASNYGYILTNVDACSVADYNIYGGHDSYSLVPAGGQSSSGVQHYTSLSSYRAACGAEAHSASVTTDPFTNNGSYASQYQVQSGSPAYRTGRIGGTSGGAACNVGAWDGTVPRIGCDFVGGQIVPDAPQLSVS